jgi:hypothetical protein
MPVNDVIKAKQAYFEAVNQCKTWRSKEAKRRVYQMGHDLDIDLR